MFAALCYAELASTIPVSGSAYTYAYATMGELIAWIIGWDLVLEYGVSVAASPSAGAATSTSSSTTRSASRCRNRSPARRRGRDGQPAGGRIVVAVTFVLIRGVRETARANLIMVVLKLLVLAFFIVVGVRRRLQHGGNL